MNEGDHALDPETSEALKLREVEDPKIYEYEVLIIVQGTALRGAATLHHLALSLAIGLQCFGTIESIVMSVTRWKVGNQDWCEYAARCSFHVLIESVLLGGYAKKVVVPIRQSFQSRRNLVFYDELIVTFSIFVSYHLEVISIPIYNFVPKLSKRNGKPS
ncbi:hypothetical protein F2Q70_00005358 [Brassica cretica]|uniref:Uncharacterized protein n=1 Tax=Brassica cretica TaxID=69181 RepID=A0A8S9IPN1_BRACR|nr:hypothetical protein F2Q70_00005358 [Brassica cretica]